MDIKIIENSNGTITIDGINENVMSALVIGLTHYIEEWKHPNYEQARNDAKELRDAIDLWYINGLEQ
jgi:hypothetical protein